MNEILRKSIDDVTPGLLRQARATLSVNRMVGVTGERIRIPLEGRDTECVFYRANEADAPLIIAYHSGGWLFGGCALNDSMWTVMADTLGMNIISVGYRMAPKHKWQASLADAYDSAVYLYQNSHSFGFDRERITLFGPSAGGNMAAAVCIKAARENMMVFKDLVLLYPLLDVSTEPALKGPEYYGGPAAYVMNEQHVLPEESKDPLASPVFADALDLKHFPRTLIVTAEKDALRHEGKLFAENLAAAGIAARCVEAEGMSHCFFELGFRDGLTDFEKGFIGPDGVKTFLSGATNDSTYKILDLIKKELKNDQC